MLHLHPRILAHRVHLQTRRRIGDRVDVHRPITALSGEELTTRIPGDSLDVVGVLGDRVDELTGADVVDVGRVVDGAGDDALAAR